LALLWRGPPGIGDSPALRWLFRAYMIAVPISIVTLPLMIVLFFWSLFLKRPVVPMAAFIWMIALGLTPSVLRTALALSLRLRGNYLTRSGARVSRAEQPVRYWSSTGGVFLLFAFHAAWFTALAWLGVMALRPGAGLG
jgi:hypothetical protein